MGIETTLPGDLAIMDTIGMGEGEPIWDRMAKIIRARRLDVRNLMGGFDRMKKGFFDLSTMRRALCNAFGNQWVELAMTQAEFAEVCEPYLTRVPLQSGEPTSMVQWRQLAQDLQMLAETMRPTADFLERLAAVEAKERASVMLVDEYGVTVDELKVRARVGAWVQGARRDSSTALEGAGMERRAVGGTGGGGPVGRGWVPTGLSPPGGGTPIHRLV